MRKKIFLAAMTAVVMTGCSNDDEVMEHATQPVIGFNALTSNATASRAVAINGTNLKENPFEVYAFTTNGQLFMGKNSESEYFPSNGVAIEHNGTGWNYRNSDEQAYWPTQALNFYAFYPKFEDPGKGFFYEVSSNDKQLIRYTIPTKAKSQTDVMYAISREVTKDSHAGKARLQFRHTLSQVLFKAKTNIPSLSVDIQSVDVRNAGFSGVLTLPAEGDLITSDNWEVKTSQAGTTSFGVFPVAMDGILTNIGTTAQQVTTDSEVQMFLPQTLKRWNPGNGNTIYQADKNGESYLAISCKIRQNGVYLHGSEEEYNYLYIPFGVKWEPGKRYTYTLVFGGGYDENGEVIIAPVNFIPEVEEWTDTPADVETEKKWL